MGKNAQGDAILDAADVLEIARVTLCLERIREKKGQKEAVNTEIHGILRLR